MRSGFFATFLGGIILLGFQSHGEENRKDSSTYSVHLNEVVVTATRTEQKSSRIPVPITIIPGSEIQSAGLLKLDEVLSELNGASIVNYFGNGLQLRG